MCVVAHAAQQLFKYFSGASRVSLLPGRLLASATTATGCPKAAGRCTLLIQIRTYWNWGSQASVLSCAAAANENEVQGPFSMDSLGLPTICSYMLQEWRRISECLSCLVSWLVVEDSCCFDGTQPRLTPEKRSWVDLRGGEPATGGNGCYACCHADLPALEDTSERWQRSDWLLHSLLLFPDGNCKHNELCTSPAHLGCMGCRVSGSPFVRLPAVGQTMQGHILMRVIVHIPGVCRQGCSGTVLGIRKVKPCS